MEVDGDLTDIASLAVGYYSSAVALADGSVRTWGYNGLAQLGDGPTGDQKAPVQPLDIAGVRAIAIACHSLVVRDDGSVWAWGRDSEGQIGDGPHNGDAWTRRKTLASGLTRPVAVSVGEYHSLALDEDGTVWAWGRNAEGQLGLGKDDTKAKDRPVQVPGIGKITAIAAGWNFSLALDDDGSVWAWGKGWCGVLGNGKDENNSSTPARVKGVGGIGHLKHVTAISAGYAHCLALLDDGTVAAWGTDYEKQGGIDEGGTFHPTPKKVYADSSKSKELTGVTALAAGWYHSLALMEDGTVAAWGWNAEGQLGDGTNTQRPTPVKVKDPGDKTKDLSGVRSIAAGCYHSIAACDWPSD